MNTTNITQASSSWNAPNLGMGPQANMLFRSGPNEEIPAAKDVFSETICDGNNGVIYVNNSRVEAVGICARGRRDGVNADAIGVVQNPDGSLLFHLADGFHMRDKHHRPIGGAEASTGVIREMTLYCCGQHGHFDRMAAEKTQRDLALNNLPLKAGSTYAGALVRRHPVPEIGYLKTDALSIGDSRIIFCDDGKLQLKNVSDNAAYGPSIRGAIQVFSPEYRETMKEMLADNPDALKWVNDMDSFTPGRLQKSLQTFLHYMFPSNMVLAYFDGMGIDRQLLFRDRLHDYFARQKSGQQLFIYSDGVDDLFTPIDIMKTFHSKTEPLHEQVYEFAQRVMYAQEYGRRIDVGVGNRIKIGGKHDNYSFWVIRMK